ncbi:anthranilate synthase component I [Desulfallas thermosapovorans]|uniref:Anthranilate synthase component 1 n=1 Tax=Desulfallas thermosapovorans DSM 6562 TaxID=1121431 RepID=A0A5S4ZTM7_9FIRM|nr:anthranilate synthase component I [Desulfallas thermosapovorans]TYO96030.1 anthranilate synthase component 1 [Desulfallas thermosapovorans DSM 6562]
MIKPGLEDYLTLARQYNLIPVYTEFIADTETPITLFIKLAQNGTACLLESVEGGRHLGRYSFIALDPLLVYESTGGRGKITYPGSITRPAGGSPFKTLHDLLQYYRVPPVAGLPRFYGGAVGYMAYDAVRSLESLPGTPRDEMNLPDCLQFFPGTVAVFDHVRHTVTLVANCPLDGTDPTRVYHRAVQKLARLRQALEKPLPAPGRFTLQGEIRVDLPDGEFCRRVKQALEYIRSGEVIQVVLSRRYAMGFNGDDLAVYRRLRSVNPSPYMYYLKVGDIRVIGSSPEMLVRVENGVITTCPIAGTRPRGDSPAREEELARELLADEKERAEHLMLVDLGRNDLGRVCRPGTVKVPRFMDIEYFSHVMHIVSRVEGKLLPGTGALEALASCFPAGTVSGAPKVRAMQIIDELEPYRRGVYAGAVGYLGFNGNMDTAIAIRTLVIKDRTVYIQAGAGIVADSRPLNECAEIASKARAMFKTLGLGEERLVAG